MKTKIFTSILIFSFLWITNLSAQNFWTQTSNLNPPAAYVPAISAGENGLVLASNWTYGIWRTMNNGTSWFQTSLATGRIFYIAKAPNGSNFAFSTATTGPKIYRSMDTGLSWLEIYDAPHANNYFFGGGLAFMDNDIVVGALSFTLGPTIGDIGVEIVRSTNGGTNWALLGTITGWGGCDAILKLNDGRILAATSLAGIWQSTNNGSFWTQVTNFPPIFTNTLAKNSRGDIFVGRSTAAGNSPLLFRSTDNTASWQPINGISTNGGSGEITSIYVDNNDKIYVSAYKFSPDERKVYCSTDNGDNWSEVISGMPANQLVYSLSGNSQNIIFAGTNNNGVFRGNDNVSAIGNETSHPEIFTLHQNFPNPFNPSTTIKYSLASMGKVILSVHDVTGKVVKTLVNSFQPQGDYSIAFNASDLTSGIYFYKLEVSANGKEYSGIKKMIMVK